MNNLIKEQVEHYLKNKVRIENALVLLTKRAAAIAHDTYFIQRIDKFYPPTFAFHSDDPDYIKEDEVMVRFEIYEYGSPDSKIFKFPISDLWEIEDWEDDLIFAYEQIVHYGQVDAEEKKQKKNLEEERQEKSLLERLREKYPEE